MDKNQESKIISTLVWGLDTEICTYQELFEELCNLVENAKKQAKLEGKREMLDTLLDWAEQDEDDFSEDCFNGICCWLSDLGVQLIREGKTKGEKE